jgi:tetratricopeptide (TPR) repeat protein
MRKAMLMLGALFMVCVFASIAAAQGTGRLNGEIIAQDGTPYANKTVILKNPDTGQTFTLKTDANGKFTQLALRSAIYTVTLPDINYTEKTQVQDGQENTYKLDLKAVAAASAAAHPEEQKKREDAEAKFKEMKTHFQAGVDAMTAADAARTQANAPSATADQKSAAKQQRVTSCTTAATEFSAAEQAVAEKDVNNHSMIWGNLGQANECAGKYDEAMSDYQKAIDLKPQGAYYTGLATNLAQVGSAAKDPAEAEAKFTAAAAACDKGAALEASTPGPDGKTAAPADTCYKNLGIVLSNKGRLKEAIPPLQKATTINPKDQQAWYLLGSAYTGTIDTKQEGDKMTYVIPPGTKDAYQKCVDIDASNGLGQQCKTMIDSLASMGTGDATSEGKRTPKKKS